jgi:extradiol dioxygenase family protein
MLHWLRRDVRAQLESKTALCHLKLASGRHVLIIRCRYKEEGLRGQVTYFLFDETGNNLEINGFKPYSQTNTIASMIERLESSLVTADFPYEVRHDSKTQEALDLFLTRCSGLIYHPRTK